jgi:hypothetical protein
MRTTTTIILSLLILLASFPPSAEAFWGTGPGNRLSLNLESGYDVNTVTTVTAQILSFQGGINRNNFQLEVESGGARMIICLGPQRYWAERGVPLKVGDKLVVRGSKAQGQDGVIYILAQKITVTSQNVVVILRDESGFPNWAGGSMRRSNGNGNGRGTGRRGGWGW